MEPPSAEHLWGSPRLPSMHPQYPQGPIVPPPGPPQSHQSIYPPPPMPPPGISAPSILPFGTPVGGVTEGPSLSPPDDIIIQPAAEAVLQPAPMFLPPFVAPSDSQQVPADPLRTQQDSRTPRMPPVSIMEGASRGTSSPPFILPRHGFGSPPVFSTRDRPSRRSLSRSRHPVVLESGSPHLPSRGSPGRPSRGHRSSHSPYRVVVEGGSSRRSHSRGRSGRSGRSRSPLPPALVLPQPSQPTIIMPESRGRPRHRTPSRRTALDRPHPPTRSQTPSPEPYQPRPSYRDSSRRPRSPIVVQQSAPILPPGTGFQPPVVPLAPTAQQPVTIVQGPPPSRRLHRSDRHRDHTSSPQRPVVVLPPGRERSRSRSWERPRHRRNFLQRMFRGRSYERPYDRYPHYEEYGPRDREPRYPHYEDYDPRDREPRYYSPGRRHERRHSRSPGRYSPEPRRQRRRRSYSYSYVESPPRTSRRSPHTIIGPDPRSTRRRGRDYSPPLVVTQGEHGGRSYRQPTVIFPGGDDRSPSPTPISIAPSHRHPRAPSIQFVPPSLRSESHHEWEAPHPLVSAH